MTMEDLFYDYLAFEFAEEVFFVDTDYICTDCDCTLLFDVEAQVMLCPECRAEHVETALNIEFEAS